MPQISIIVPVYNVEDYLERCIDSILSQTFIDYELILIDDGSTDSSGKLCDQYAKKDKRIRVFHKVNEGVSKARNLGLDVAKGNYISFVDSDDYIKKDCLMVLFKSITENDYDCVSMDFSMIGNDENKDVLHQHDIYSFSDDKELFNHIVQKVLQGKTGWEIWSRLFKADIIRRFDIRMCETCNDFAEDLSFFLTYLLHCKKVCNIDYIGYYYFQREKSMMNISKNLVRLNEMNVISKFFFNQLSKSDRCIIENYSVVHFLIVYNQLKKVEKNGSYSMVPKYTKEIADRKWYRKHILKVVLKKRLLALAIEKSQVKEYRNLCFYTIHNNFYLFRITRKITRKI